jgi:hypothetical protein
MRGQGPFSSLAQSEEGIGLRIFLHYADSMQASSTSRRKFRLEPHTIAAAVLLTLCLFVDTGLAQQSSETSAAPQTPAPTSVALFSTSEIFTAGVNALKARRLSEAQQAFARVLDEEPRHPDAILNLGLSFDPLQKDVGLLQLAKPYAIWQAGLSWHPRHPQILEAWAWVREQIQQRSRAQNSTFDLGETLHDQIFVSLPLGAAALVAILLLTLGIGLIMTFIARRRQARETESPAPPWPWAAALILSLGLMMGMISLGAWADRQVTRAVLIAEAELRAAPELTAPELLKLNPATRVQVLESKGEWRRVALPGGRGGWVPAATIFLAGDPAQKLLASPQP